MAHALPVIDSCDGCGACCGVVRLPPFRRYFDEPGGEEGWDRLRWERPDLFTQILEADRARRERGESSTGSPCLWFDPDSKRCRHHALRPSVCREFAIGGVDCLDARRRSGVAGSFQDPSGEGK
jgi:Fe-S-cluster containining protein